MVVAIFIPNVPLELAAKSKQKKFKTFLHSKIYERVKLNFKFQIFANLRFLHNIIIINFDLKFTFNTQLYDASTK
jgi:hypothetical protein